jgi:anti-sigma regulatory factor (Ser/Thr protein kinase)
VTAELLAAFGVASVPGNERLAIARVQAAVAGLGLTDDALDRLGTAVGETVMNAIEHGHHDHADLLVEVEVRREASAVVVTVTDHGGAPSSSGSAEPDLELKLAGEQSPRGWGLFLIRHMVDEMTVETVGRDHTVRLVVEGAPGRQEEML